MVLRVSTWHGGLAAEHTSSHMPASKRNRHNRLPLSSSSSNSPRGHGKRGNVLRSCLGAAQLVLVHQAAEHIWKKE